MLSGPFRLIETMAWLAILTLFSLVVASGSLLGGAVIVGGVGFLLLLLQRPVIIAIVWLVGASTVFVLANNVLDAIPLVTVERILFCVLFGLVSLLAVADRTCRQRLDAAELAIIGFIGICAISLAQAMPDKSLATIREDLAFLVQGYVMPFGAFMLTRRMRWSLDDVSVLTWLLVATGVFLAIVGALQTFFGIGWFTPRYLEVIHEGRATGTFPNATEYGAVLVISLLMCLFRLQHGQDGLVRAVLLVSALVILVGIGLCKTRAVWLAAVVMLALVFIWDRKSRTILTIGLALGTIALLISLPFLDDSQMVRTRIFDLSPIYNRLALLSTSLNIIVHNPLLGVGFGHDGFIESRSAYLTGFGSVSAQWAADVGVPHNEYLHLAVLAGLPGLLLFVLILYLAQRRLGRNAATAQADSLIWRFATYVRAGLSVLVVVGLFVDLGFFIYLGILLFALTGAAEAAARPKSPQDNHVATPLNR